MKASCREAAIYHVTNGRAGYCMTATHSREVRDEFLICLREELLKWVADVDMEIESRKVGT